MYNLLTRIYHHPLSALAKLGLLAKRVNEKLKIFIVAAYGEAHAVK